MLLRDIPGDVFIFLGRGGLNVKNASGASGVGLGCRCGLRVFKGYWQLRPLPESAYRRLIKRVRNRELHVP